MFLVPSCAIFALMILFLIVGDEEYLIWSHVLFAIGVPSFRKGRGFRRHPMRHFFQIKEGFVIENRTC